MVTAEAAVVLPVLVLLALAGVAAVGVGQARVRCADAAGEAARAIARGDPNAAGPLAVAAAGRPVALTSVIDGDRTTVTVRIRVRPPGWPRELTITESATAATEPGAANGLGSAGLGSTSLGSAGQSSNGP